MASYEEHFATSSDDESSIKPVRRYATRSKSTVVDQLKKENLEQVLEKKCSATNKHEERIHYLQLDLANKEIVIQEMIVKMEKLEKIYSVLNDYEIAIKIARSNIICYNNLLNSVSTVDVGTLMRKELVDIKEHKFIIEMNEFPGAAKDTMIHIYTDTTETEGKVRDKFYAKLNSSRQKNYIVFLLEGIIGALLFLYYIYIQFFCSS